MTMMIPACVTATVQPHKHKEHRMKLAALVLLSTLAVASPPKDTPTQRDVLADHLGPSIVSRMHEGGTVIACEWAGYRGRKVTQ